MAFNSAVFLLVFAPIFFIGYCILPGTLRLAWLLTLSVAFYAYGEPTFVFVLLASSVIDYWIVARLVGKGGRAAQVGLTVGVGLNLLLLFYFKYVNFAAESLAPILGTNFGFAGQIVFPLALSFVVFEKITYLVDVYRSVSAPARSLRDHLIFVFLFPKLVAGPIQKFHDLRSQIEKPTVNAANFRLGLARFLMGLGKKVLIADVIGGYVDHVFAADANSVGFAQSWTVAVAFSAQIYVDFSAYSDMAIGLALMLGIKLPENFRQPYLSVGFVDFWKRWHISLSTWIRDYLYVPLGGGRCGQMRTFANLWICFVLSGLWHGASWNFLLWGVYHGIFVSLDHFGLRAVLDRLPRAIGIGLTFIAVTIGWQIFRSKDLYQAFTLIRHMFSPDQAESVPYAFDLYLVVPLAVAALISFIPVGSVEHWKGRFSASQRFRLADVVLLWIFILSLGRIFSVEFSPFLYFRF